jgi:hypothetical protein
MTGRAATVKGVGKVWILDTETKGTGASMVPLESTLRRPAADPEPLYVPREPAPREPEPPPVRPPRTFRVVDVVTGAVIVEGTDTRATVAALEDVARVVDVRISVWDPDREQWRLLTLGEQNALWRFRGRRQD